MPVNAFFLLLSILSSLCILDRSPLSNIYETLFCSLPFNFLNSIFQRIEVSIFDEVQFIHFFFSSMCHVFGIMSEIFLPSVFFSRSLIVSAAIRV